MASPSLDWSSRSSPIHQRSSPPTAYSSAIKSSPVPDTTSSVYPDRLIRPLPKKRLRDRLSAQQTEDIVFPSVPNKEAPLFSFPYPEANNQKDSKESSNVNDVDGRGGNSRAVRRDTGSGSGPERAGMTKSSPRQGTLRQRPQGRSSMGKSMSTPPRSSGPVDSANSSVDGDESFENTNNKKKRKIPQPQHSMSSAGTLLTNVSTDMANLGLSTKESDATAGMEGMDGQTAYHSPGGTGSLNPASMANSGLPGSGRRVYGRSGRGSLDRRPLTTSTNALNFSGSARSRLSPSTKTKAQNLHLDAAPGIISSAIANAQQQNSPLPPQKGGENVSLLEEATKPPQTGNFTFTCDPPSDKLVWPGQSAMGPSPNNSGYPTPSSQYPNASARAGASGTNSASQTPQLPQDQQGQQAPPKKTRPRRPGRVYELAARQRRLQQEYANHLHPPRREDIWICEFCEYEAIYGQPPRALIHMYEVKDRKEQRRQEERRRLLEKAKIKGRKGKKAAASAAKQASKSLAHQAAEFQKNEMLRATAKLETHKQQLQQAHRELQAHNAAAAAAAAAANQQQLQNLQQPTHDQLYDDDEDEDEEDLEYDDEGVYDDEEDEGGDTEELDENYYPDDAPQPQPQPPPPPLEGRSYRRR